MLTSLERHRPELTGYCTRLLRSRADAEDAVQEALVRAWRSMDRFESRSSVRTWLYRIAHNVCLDLVDSRDRRPPSFDPTTMREDADRSGSTEPALVALEREAVRDAFATMVLHLPVRQRAALVLCEVLCWRAAEAADLLGTSVAAVNSALQRARATLRGLHDPGDAPAAALTPSESSVVRRYTQALVTDDVAALVRTVRSDIADDASSQ